MKPWPQTDEIEVGLDFGVDGHRHVGTIARTGESTYFAYDDEITSTGINPAPISLPFDTSPFILPIRDGAPGSMFADAVPDGWTRHLLEARLIERGYDPKSLSALDRLALVGGNGAGALSFKPEQSLGQPVKALSLSDLAATISASQKPGDAGLETARRYAGSLGGMRPKANIWMRGKGDDFSPAPEDGSEPWIVKFPRPGFDPTDAGPIEYAYSLMARAAGVTMTPTRLLSAKDGMEYFATARFDRHGARRYHYQSLAGLLDIDILTPSSYRELFTQDMLLSSSNGPDEQLIRRMTFNVLAANRDDHSRNHGFLMDATGRWTPSPAFDLTFEPLKQHSLVVGSNSASPGEEELVAVVVEAGGDERTARGIYREIRDVIDEWPSFARDAGIAASTVERVNSAIQNMRRGENQGAILAAKAAAMAGWGR